jgi:hypothetical protein
MSTTVLYDGRAFMTQGERTEGDDLWLSAGDLHGATGWQLKPEGVCHGERCVPIPPARRSEFLGPDGNFNLAAFARYLNEPVVHDDDAGVWFFGKAPAARRNALLAGEAPDFRLPDLDGNLHSLSDYRGRKVLLMTWASW